MAMRPRHPCNKAGCRNLTTERYCEEHKAEKHKAYDRYRGSAAERGYGSRWRKARVQHLTEHPLCVDCLANGILTPATDVDHETPHRGDMILFWDKDNWAGRCHSCHSKKTVREDGGFGKLSHGKARNTFMR